jgi:hypothetical protein
MRKLKVQAILRDYKTLGVKKLFIILFSLNSSSYLDSEVAPKSPTIHAAIRCEA